MSALEDKLVQQRRSTGGKAQATRKQLLARWGSRETSPDLITIYTMGGVESWRRVSGDVFVQEVAS